MGFLKKLEQSTDLFNGMTERLGVNLADRIAVAPESASTYRAAVLSCSACDQSGACKDWQASHDTATQTPEYCRNKMLLASMVRV